jgi:phage gp36-like protein
MTGKAKIEPILELKNKIKSGLAEAKAKMRFIKENDYSMQIKSEIIKLLTDSTIDWYQNQKLLRAEQTALAQIRNRIGARYDCDAIFAGAANSAEDARDQWVVTLTIDIALYHLYSQTGMKDMPVHRTQRYQDALDWLKDVSNGTVTADLPALINEDTGEEYSDFRFNSRAPENQKW